MNRNKRNFRAFFIYPRKSYNKYTICILKIRQSMQIYKNIKKCLTKRKESGRIVKCSNEGRKRK